MVEVSRFDINHHWLCGIGDTLPRGLFGFNSKQTRVYFEPVLKDSFHYFRDWNNEIDKTFMR